MRELRRALGDQARALEFIETVHRRGYRFIATVKAIQRARESDTTQASQGEGPTAEETATSRSEKFVQDQKGEGQASRRQLTVMFCALVEFTTLARQFDPEELRELTQVYYRACTKVIHHYDGYMAQYLGDRLLVYFGYPHAHEDDAQRAVRAGLDILRDLDSLNARVEEGHGVRIAVRVGIHTGLVVVGGDHESGSQERLAFGEAPNLAAWLQSLASPNQIVLSDETRRLAGERFSYEDVVVKALKGVEASLQIYRVVREQTDASRFDATVIPNLTTLVGREEERALLLRHWEQAKAGEGQVILISGEAGIGKSRLAHTLREQVDTEGYYWVQYQCSPYHRNSAFYPFMMQLEKAAEFTRDDTDLQKLAKLEALLWESTEAHDDVPLVATLLSIPTGDRYPALNLSPQQQRARTIKVLADQIVGLAYQQPLCVTMEDAHWSDPTSLEVLNAIRYRALDMQVLVVITSRPEFDVHKQIESHITVLTLNRLSQSQSVAMVNRLTAGNELSPATRDDIVTKADGIPLFIEEVTKTVIETARRDEDGDRDQLPRFSLVQDIPQTLQGLLLARLDRLGAVVEVAQIGATLGREFTYDLIAAVVRWRDSELEDALHQLVESGLLFCSGRPPESSYRFKHALIQAAAYGLLLVQKRQQLHARIAQVIDDEFPTLAATEPELLARHYAEARLYEEAVTYYYRAGQQALQRSAHLETVNQISRGLALLKSLPATPATAGQEVDLQMTLGPALTATKGYAAPEVEQTYARALALCDQVGETPQLFPVLRGLWIFNVLRGRLQAAHELGGQCLALAHRLHDVDRLPEAHRVLGTTLFYLGEFRAALAHFEQGIEQYDPHRHRTHAFLYGQDPGVTCRTYAAWTLWFLGYSDKALDMMNSALSLARELSHPFTLADALVFAAGLHEYRREGSLAQECSEEAIALSAPEDFTFMIAMGTIRLGSGLAQQGQIQKGIALIQQGNQAFQDTGAVLPPNLVAQGEAHGRSDQLQDRLDTLERALDVSQQTGECYYDAELHRLKGEFLLQFEQTMPAAQGSRSKVVEAESCFRRALDIARRQQAKSCELRATVSLSRLWFEQGQREKARTLLAPVYSWFTEGFDTADLQEAKALIEEQSQ